MNTKAKHSRNPAGAGTIRQKTVRRNGKEYTYWEGRYTTGFDPGTGKQVQRSITGKTQREVAQKLRQITTEIDNGLYKAPSKLTLGDWLDTWSQEYLGAIKPSSAFLYRENIRLYIRPALGTVKLDALTPLLVQRFYNQLASPRGDKPALSAKTIKNIHGVLHKALQQAVSVGLLRFNPSETCTLPRIQRKEIQPLDSQQATDFLAAIQGHKHQTLYTVALFTGMREGEILGLMWSCVDFTRNTILVDKQLRRSQEKGGAYYFSSPKNNKSRLIPVAPSVMDLLRLHQQEQKRQQSFVGPGWVNSQLVFTNEIGDRLSYRTVYDCFKRIVAKIGCPHARFHDLRHTYAVLALENHVDIKTVQESLGHHTAAFTLDIYGHVTDRMRQQSAQQLEDCLRRLTAAPQSEPAREN